MIPLALIRSGSRVTLAVLCTAGWVSSQTTWFVDQAAAGPGTGGAADPWPSIQVALDAPSVVDGDTVSVAPGVYIETVNFGEKLVTVLSQAGPLATEIVAPRTIGTGSVVRMSQGFGAVGAELVGFTVRGTPGASSRGVSGFGGLVRRSILRDHAFGVFSDYDLFAEQCTITGCATGASMNAFIGIAYLSNTIVHGNGTDLDAIFEVQGFAQYSLWGSGPVALGSSTGPNYPASDPLFWKPGADLHLRPGSPAIDAGNPQSPPDADGSVADLGALPYDPSYAPPPSVYCTPKLSSDGCLAVIAASGTASFTSPAPMTITASNASEHKSGLFFYGLGAAAFPFQGGWFCLEPPAARTGLVNSGSAGAPCSGMLSLDFNAYLQSVQPFFVAPGDLLYGQYWLRDPGDPFGSVRTDAVEFGVTP